MIYSPKKMWLSIVISSSLFVVVLSDGPEYLPPSKGYNYDKPSIPFETNNNGNKQPSPGPVRPPVQPPRPTYIPSPGPGPAPGPRPDLPSPGPVRPPVQPPRPTYIPSPGPGPAPGPRPDPHDHSHDHGHDHHHEPGMPFDFAYQVTDDGNDYSHNAISDGDITRGEYRVALPDGRTQIVKYTADWKNGFNAEVTYEGEARYPEPPAGGYGPSNGGGQAYIPPSQGGGYQY